MSKSSSAPSVPKKTKSVSQNGPLGGKRKKETDSWSGWSSGCGDANKPTPKGKSISNYAPDVPRPKIEYSKILVFVSQAKNAKEKVPQTYSSGNNNVSN
jgi:hypothetical protein